MITDEQRLQKNHKIGNTEECLCVNYLLYFYYLCYLNDLHVQRNVIA